MLDRPESRPRPGWLNKIAAANMAAFEALTPEERAEAKADKDARRARVEARRLASIERARTICRLYFDGYSDVEIGRAICRTSRSVRRFAELRGFIISRSRESVSRLVPIARAGEDALRALAERNGVTPASALEQLVALLLGNEAEIARRMLRNPELARQALATAFGARTSKSAK